VTDFPGVGKTRLAQAVGYETIKMNFQVLYRSIFDLVRDFMKDGSLQPARQNPAALP
jgi:DNA replication protein DnaC